MILKDIWLDVKAVKERDPAARNALEVLLLYQGVHALIWHRVALSFSVQHTESQFPLNQTLSPWVLEDSIWISPLSRRTWDTSSIVSGTINHHPA